MRDLKTHYDLTSKETKILACLVERKTAKEIADIIGITEKAVNSHIYNLRPKVGGGKKTQIADSFKASTYVDELNEIYQCLDATYKFNKELEHIKHCLPFKLIKCKLSCYDDELKKKIKNDLEILNIQCCQNLKGGFIHVEKCDNYPLTFLKVLIQLIPSHPSITEAIARHKDAAPLLNADLCLHLKNPNTSKNDIPVKTKVGHKYFITKMLLSLMILGSVGCSIFVCYEQVKYVPIRSDFSLPIAEYFLKRPRIINKIYEKFKIKNNIQTVVIWGIGGIGKTTIARQYAREQNAPIVWEINAETKNALLNSFARLAYAVSKKDEEKIELERIQKIENHQEYTQKLNYFVKQRLKKQKNWFLVFDNVQALSEIQPFFPADSDTWGKGKILITTRNKNIAHEGFIPQSQIVALDELTPHEKRELFLKIQEKPEKDQKKLEIFLEKIPPFPLDVSVAAYHIKNIGDSYDEYLDQLQIKKKSNNRLIFPLIAMNDYTETRQQIIVCAVEQILCKHEDFIGLLLLISTIDHQNIPKNLLKRYCNVLIVDAFIQKMSKYSLLHCKKEKNSDEFILEMHFSIQEIIMNYLFNSLNKGKLDYYLNKAEQTIYNYSDKIIESFEIQKIRNILPCLCVFSKRTLAPRKEKIFFQVGRGYYCLGDYLEAKRYFELSIACLRVKSNTKQTKFNLLAKTLAYLSAVNIELGYLDIADKAIVESIDIYKNIPSENLPERAFALMNYGHLSYELGAYNQAENAIMQSIAIYQKQNKTNHPEIAWALLHLGDMYEKLGRLKEAKRCYEKSLRMHKKFYGDFHKKTVHCLFRLGVAHKTDGKYKDALELIHKSYEICKEKYPTDNEIYTWILPQLGDVFRLLGLYHKSCSLLEDSIEKIGKYCGKDSIHINWSEIFLGKLYTNMGCEKKALTILRGSLGAHEAKYKQNHIKVMRTKHALANVFVGLDKIEQAYKLYQECLPIYRLHYGEQHIAYAHILCDFGYLYVCKKDYTTAKTMIQKALEILAVNKHDETYRCYEYLGHLYKIKGQKEKSKEYYAKAFVFLKQHFPKNSAHIIRLKKNMPFSLRAKLFVQSFFLHEKSI